MFIHSGAAMHRHEYSVPLATRPKSIPRRTPLTRSTFSSPVLPTHYDRPTPIIRHTETASSDSAPRYSEHTVRFQEPGRDTMDEDSRSIANSEGSVTTAGGSGRRRKTRASSSFHIAHPAPTLSKKQRLLQIRPKLLFQLQHSSADSRPKPAIDVLPSTVVVPRLMKKFPRIFKGKGELGVNDVMVVRSEAYDVNDKEQPEGTDSDEEGISNRQLLAVICQARRDSGGSVGKAEIVLDDGSSWAATPMQNGQFEFVTVDEHGIKTTARWVKRPVKRKSVDLPEYVDDYPEAKFTFSIIDPSTRRHPIMATITPKKLDIPDYYATPSSSSGKFPPVSPLRPLPEDYGPSLEEANPPLERKAILVDEELKILIQVTGIWVALRLGWSPYFKYNDVMTVNPSSSTRSRTAPGNRTRSMSLSPGDGDHPNPAASSDTPESIHSAFAGVGGKIRRTCNKVSPTNSGPSSPVQRPSLPPKRAVSTGSAFMQRAAAARRAGNPPSTVFSESEGELLIDPPKGAITGDFQSSPTITPQPVRNRSGSLASSQETPTRSQGRVQSVYVPRTTPQHYPTELERFSIDLYPAALPSKFMEKHKKPRWKAFGDFFRRATHSSKN